MRRLVLVACVSTFVACLGPKQASGCINGVEIRVDPRVELVAQAERDLREHRLADAGSLLVKAFPRVRDAKTAKTNLGQRALRVAALVVLRSRGELGEDGKALVATARDDRVAWAVRQLRLRAIARVSEPAPATDLAEGLSYLPGYGEEAKRILEVLAAQQTITSAEGWGALARLRAAAGDEKGREAAQSECKRMAFTQVACAAPTSA
jgi:hypothetical protein